jgi:putative nucleotidyltransferase with HDIG domain
MNKKDLVTIEKWFQNMVNFYSAADSVTKHNLALKQSHSKATQQIALQLSQSMGWSQHDCGIAECIGLLHDVGRFPQFYYYKTFGDNESRNHAHWGVEVLQKEQVLSVFSEEDQELINTAILHHNAFQIPPPIQGRILTFCRLIRDADKLDIYRIMSEEHYILDLPDTHDVNPLILDSIFKQKCVQYKHVTSLMDLKLLQLSWVYDFYFTESLFYLQKQELLQKFIHTIPASIQVSKAYETVKKFLSEKTSATSVCLKP